MRKGRRRAARALGLGLALALAALLVSAAWAGVRALGESPQRHITLAMTPNFPATEPLVAGDVLRLDVTAAADFAAHSSGTVIYYDSSRFSPCNAAGAAFTTQVRGTGIESYLVLNPNHPLCKAGTAFGEVNASSRDGYAAVALNVPYDLAARPVPGVPAADMPWFSFYLKVIAPTDTGAASIFMEPGDLRAAGSRTGPVYYSAEPGGAGWLHVETALPARLDYTIERAVANPVTVNFTAGTHGALAGGVTSIRNIEAGTTIAAQSARRWPSVSASLGYRLAGWAYAAAPDVILSGDTPLGAAGGDIVDLLAVFEFNPNWFEPYVEGGASRALRYKSSTALRLVTGAQGDVTWSSANPDVVFVNEHTGEIRGVGRGTAVITGRDGDGFEVRVNVTVNYAWWQWAIVVLLFGWIWY